MICCATPGCLGEARSSGLCRPCYYRQWRQKNAEKVKADKRAWYEQNRDVTIARSRARQEADIERKREYQRAYLKRNAKPRVLVTIEEKRARKAVAQRRREARKRNAPINDFTLQQWQEILVEHGAHCHYCGAADLPLVQEHMTPLSRGGSNTKSNITPSCGPCNARKRSKTAEEYLASLVGAA